MTGRAVDPDRSRIVLVGASEYRDAELADVPQVSASLHDLAAVLTGPALVAFPRKHCVIAPPHASVEQVGDLLHQAAEEAEGLLVF